MNVRLQPAQLKITAPARNDRAGLAEHVDGLWALGVKNVAAFKDLELDDVKDLGLTAFNLKQADTLSAQRATADPLPVAASEWQGAPYKPGDDGNPAQGADMGAISQKKLATALGLSFIPVAHPRPCCSTKTSRRRPYSSATAPSPSVPLHLQARIRLKPARGADKAGDFTTNLSACCGFCFLLWGEYKLDLTWTNIARALRIACCMSKEAQAAVRSSNQESKGRSILSANNELLKECVQLG